MSDDQDGGGSGMTIGMIIGGAVVLILGAMAAFVFLVG